MILLASQSSLLVELVRYCNQTIVITAILFCPWARAAKYDVALIEVSAIMAVSAHYSMNWLVGFPRRFNFLLFEILLVLVSWISELETTKNEIDLMGTWKWAWRDISILVTFPLIVAVRSMVHVWLEFLRNTSHADKGTAKVVKSIDVAPIADDHRMEVPKEQQRQGRSSTDPTGLETATALPTLMGRQELPLDVIHLSSSPKWYIRHLTGLSPVSCPLPVASSV